MRSWDNLANCPTKARHLTDHEPSDTFRPVFMLLKPIQRLISPGRLRRGIAIFLVAFAFFDLTVVDMISPELCGDEQESLFFANESQPAEESVDEPGAISEQDSKPAQDTHQSPADEDCFCCCSHIIPGICVNVAVLNNSPQPGVLEIASLPSSPPRDAFHPPRIS